MNFTPNTLAEVDWNKIPQDISVLHRPETCYWDGEVQVEEAIYYVKNLTEHDDIYRGDIVNSFFKVVCRDDGFSKDVWSLVERGAHHE